MRQPNAGHHQQEERLMDIENQLKWSILGSAEDVKKLQGSTKNHH